MPRASATWSPESLAQALSPPQLEIFLDLSRYRVVCAGRRFGKTVLAVNELLHKAQSGPSRRVWYVAPTYRQAEQICWQELKAAVPALAIAKKDETDLSIRLRGYGAEIALRGADNPDSLRGVGLDLVVFDEYADIDPRAWTEVIRPALADRQGDALFLGTPRGYNHFYELWISAQTTPEWRAWQFTTLQGGNVPPEEVEAARRDLDPRIFRQEYEASFESLSGRVYYAFDRRQAPEGNLADVALPEDGELLVGMDFNVNPMSAVVCARAGDELHVVHEVEIQSSSTEEMAAEIGRRWPGRPVVVYPDPSGNSRRTSAPVGQTDFTLLRRAGFQVVAPPAAPPVVDRINTVNALLCSAEGRRRLMVHPRCRSLVKALDGLAYKPETSQPDKSSGLDHITDALGYAVLGVFPLPRGGDPAFVWRPW